jgi:hypothetical protein
VRIERLDFLVRLWETYAPLTLPILKEKHRRFGLRDAQEVQPSLEGLMAEGSVRLCDDSFVTVTDKGLKELGFVRPRLERQRKMLRALRQRRSRDIENNVWSTTFNLGELRKIVGLTLGETAELLHILLREEYVDGSLDLRGTPSVTVEGLTRKGLEEIDKLSASAAQAWSAPEIHVDQNRGADVFPPASKNDPPAVTGGGTVTVRETIREIRERLVDQGGSFVEGISPIITALSGFVAVLVALAYPVGLIVLWMQLSGEFKFGFWRSLYAASMASTTMVVGNVLFVLFWALLSSCPNVGVVCVHVATHEARCGGYTCEPHC